MMPNWGIINAGRLLASSNVFLLSPLQTDHKIAPKAAPPPPRKKHLFLEFCKKVNLDVDVLAISGSIIVHRFMANWFVSLQIGKLVCLSANSMRQALILVALFLRRPSICPGEEKLGKPQQQFSTVRGTPLPFSGIFC